MSGTPRTMTPERLVEIREADARVHIEFDRDGGAYVRQKDASIFGARAIVHRRELLAALEAGWKSPNDASLGKEP
ncbi:MAG TPA: hypothetical protein VGL34_28550 [Steroidobacteraceae bacterium]|jgi:hypothetical protein